MVIVSVFSSSFLIQTLNTLYRQWFPLIEFKNFSWQYIPKCTKIQNVQSTVNENPPQSPLLWLHSRRSETTFPKVCIFQRFSAYISVPSSLFNALFLLSHSSPRYQSISSTKLYECFRLHFLRTLDIRRYHSLLLEAISSFEFILTHSR